MGILNSLTLILITLKLLGVIDWNWWIVLLPSIIRYAGMLFGLY